MVGHFRLAPRQNLLSAVASVLASGRAAEWAVRQVNVDVVAAAGEIRHAFEQDVVQVLQMKVRIAREKLEIGLAEVNRERRADQSGNFFPPYGLWDPLKDNGAEWVNLHNEEARGAQKQIMAPYHRAKDVL
jgi:hypothetical protein